MRDVLKLYNITYSLHEKLLGVEQKLDEATVILFYSLGKSRRRVRAF